jgi:hypothetical protein
LNTTISSLLRGSRNRRQIMLTTVFLEPINALIRGAQRYVLQGDGVFTSQPLYLEFLLFENH